MVCVFLLGCSYSNGEIDKNSVSITSKYLYDGYLDGGIVTDSQFTIPTSESNEILSDNVINNYYSYYKVTIKAHTEKANAIILYYYEDQNEKEIRERIEITSIKDTTIYVKFKKKDSKHYFLYNIEDDTGNEIKIFNLIKLNY